MHTIGSRRNHGTRRRRVDPIPFDCLKGVRASPAVATTGAAGDCHRKRFAHESIRHDASPRVALALGEARTTAWAASPQQADVTRRNESANRADLSADPSAPGRFMPASRRRCIAQCHRAQRTVPWTNRKQPRYDERHRASRSCSSKCKSRSISSRSWKAIGIGMPACLPTCWQVLQPSWCLNPSKASDLDDALVRQGHGEERWGKVCRIVSRIVSRNLSTILDRAFVLCAATQGFR